VLASEPVYAPSRFFGTDPLGQSVPGRYATIEGLSNLDGGERKAAFHVLEISLVKPPALLLEYPNPNLNSLPFEKSESPPID
jgi:hypothetical protein